MNSFATFMEGITLPVPEEQVPAPTTEEDTVIEQADRETATEETEAAISDAQTLVQESTQLLTTITQMTALRDHIKQYGVDKTVLRLFNTHGELTQYVPSIPAAEAFDEHRASDISIAAVEDIGKMLGNAWSKFTRLIRRMCTGVRRAWLWLFNYNKYAHEVISEAITGLKGRTSPFRSCPYSGYTTETLKKITRYPLKKFTDILVEVSKSLEDISDTGRDIKRLIDLTRKFGRENTAMEVLIGTCPFVTLNINTISAPTALTMLTTIDKIIVDNRAFDAVTTRVLDHLDSIAGRFVHTAKTTTVGTDTNGNVTYSKGSTTSYDATFKYMATLCEFVLATVGNYTKLYHNVYKAGVRMAKATMRA